MVFLYLWYHGWGINYLWVEKDLFLQGVKQTFCADSRAAQISEPYDYSGESTNLIQYQKSMLQNQTPCT